jgi:2-methylisocitrate lyase-like PEP mutase family enzyme
MPNAWDAASARAIEAAGFAAVATTSGGVAASLGYDDGERAPVGDMLAAAGRIAHSVRVPVTVDAEAGYGLAAPDLVERLVAAGAAGCNLEDTDYRAGGLRSLEAQAAWLAEVRAAADASGIPLVVNARVDVHVRKFGPEVDRLDEAIRRGRAYLGAGADCVYPIMVTDEPTIARLVEGIRGPVNVIFRAGGPSLMALANLGVARVTYGSGLQRQSITTFAAVLGRIQAGADPL